MRNKYYIYMLCMLSLCACNDVSNPPNGNRMTIQLNENWKFTLGDDNSYSEQSFNDSDWRDLNIPHDWSIEGEFKESHPATPGGGALPGGKGWYRKSFATLADWSDKSVTIEFDGVYMNSEVWINEQYLGIRPNGYIGFSYDLSPHLNPEGEENVIAVRVNNNNQPNSRWYTGSGIYRNVRIVAKEKLHFGYNGIYVSTPSVADNKAEVSISSTIVNDDAFDRDAVLISWLVSPKGQEVGIAESAISIKKDSVATIMQSISIRNPELWSVDNPALYRVESRIMHRDECIDDVSTKCGIRYFEFSKNEGFLLNGESVKIKGVCMHHDLGALGSAFNYRAAQRQLQILKDMGCNGIRTSHNPAAPEYLDLCDEMGFIVMNETFDIWRKRKSPFDYSLYFDDWHQKDLEDQILRDRNHPSVFMWCVGNEVLEQWDHASNDELDLQAANMLINFQSEEQKMSAEKKEVNLSAMIAQRLSDIVRKLDPTRPVTSGNNEPGAGNNLFLSGAMDLIGVNYHESDWDDVINRYGDKPFIATETTSALMTRGFYEMPSDKKFIRPVDWRTAFTTPHSMCSSYDNCHVPWGNTHEGSWHKAKSDDRIAGLYMWTGFDYLGEPTPYWWPARSSYFGIVDLAGIPKDIYYFYQSEWTDKDVLHVFPHWNWAKNDTIDLWAYYNNADEVELFVNDKSLGAKSKVEGQYHVKWRVGYEPGSVRAVSRKNGKTVKEHVIRTAGEASSLALNPDRSRIRADGQDLSFITVDVTDSEGNLVPTAANRIEFTVEGPGVIEGIDNGSQISHESMKDNIHDAFFGKCVVILRSTKEAGTITVRANSNGIKEKKVMVYSE